MAKLQFILLISVLCVFATISAYAVRPNLKTILENKLPKYDGVNNKNEQKFILKDGEEDPPASPPTDPETTEAGTTTTEQQTTTTEEGTTTTTEQQTTTTEEATTTTTEQQTTTTEEGTTATTEKQTTTTEEGTTATTEKQTTTTEEGTTATTEKQTTTTEEGTTATTEKQTTTTEEGTTATTEKQTTTTEEGTTATTEQQTTTTEEGTTATTEQQTTTTEEGTTTTEHDTTTTETGSTGTEGTTDETTTEGSEGTTSPPIPANQPDYVIKEDGKACILAKIGVTITVPYERADGDVIRNTTQQISPPKNPQVTGLCSGKKGTLMDTEVTGPLLILTWNWPGPRIQAKDKIPVKDNYLAIAFKTEDDETSISQITSSITIDDHVFINATDNQVRKFTVKVTGYTAEKDESYSCNDASEFGDGKTGAVKIKDVKFQVGSDLKEAFSEGSDCNDSGDDTVAIAVGVTVAVLVVAVVGGFIFKRYRDKK